LYQRGKEHHSWIRVMEIYTSTEQIKQSGIFTQLEHPVALTPPLILIRITRGQAKAVNFAICYGGTAWSIQGALGCELSSAHQVMRELSAIYPGVTGYLDSIAEALDKAPVAQRHVTSLWGRRRCFYHKGPLTSREKRQVKNAVVQMLEADVFKITVLELHRAFRAEDLPVKMVLLLHDGIWFTCPSKRVTVTRVTEAIQKTMENSVSLAVPLKVELS
jgi:DNA polymerase I